MTLRKGQVVVIEGRGLHPSINGQHGVLLHRDAASGRYRAQLVDQPWRCVKVSRSALRPWDPSEIEEIEDAEAGNEPKALEQTKISPAGSKMVSGDGYAKGSCHYDAGCFDVKLTKCDFNIGAFTVAEPAPIPEHLLNATSSLPPSPVKRGRMEARAKPLPAIKQGERYRELSKSMPCSPENSKQVHRQRRFFFSNFSDAHQEHIVGLPSRRPPVRRGKAHRLLPHADSESLRATFEEDFQAEFYRKLHQVRVSQPFLPSQDNTFDQMREEEMTERLERIQQRVERAKQEREAERARGEQQRQRELKTSFHDECLMTGSSRKGIQEEEPEEESEEQRITREFKEYELESLSHSHTAPSTPSKRDLPREYEGFEEDDEDFEKDDAQEASPQEMEMSAS